MENKNKRIVVILIAFSFLPIWTSGLRENMTLYEWVVNHTVFGAASEYLRPEHYLPDQPTPLEVMACPK